MTGVRRAAGVLGELLITAGLVVLLFAVYELWGTGFYTNAQQDTLLSELTESWSEPAPAATGTKAQKPVATAADVPIGKGMAVLRIPRFGDYAKVVVEGVGTEDLKRGPGHYPKTALPGEIGNFVVSGHRTTYGGPFNRIDELGAGDPIVVQTRDRWSIYRVTTTKVVPPTATDVIRPVPEQPGKKATKAVLTLTTCHPEFSARQRLIVFAELDRTQATSDGEPAELTGA